MVPMFFMLPMLVMSMFLFVFPDIGITEMELGWNRTDADEFKGKHETDLIANEQ